MKTQIAPLYLTALGACSLGLYACNTEQYQPINIAVYPSTRSCTIKDYVLDCSTLPEYLVNTVKAHAGREITVSYAGTEKPSPEDKSLERIAELIQKAGFKDVKVIRFDM
jgi:hypothetical protein